MTRKHAPPSICWDCANAYVDRCAWVKDGIQIWERAVSVAGRNHGDAAYSVQECKYFVLE